MTKDEAITNRDNWKQKKSDYEDKLDRLKNAKQNYLTSLESGEWRDLLADFYTFKGDVDPSFSAVDWEGKRVSNYRQKLEDLMGSLNIENGKHYDVVTQFEEQIQTYETKIEDAQDEIDYWQDIIDNWSDEEE